jgi:hypothetical protein
MPATYKLTSTSGAPADFTSGAVVAGVVLAVVPVAAATIAQRELESEKTTQPHLAADRRVVWVLRVARLVTMTLSWQWRQRQLWQQLFVERSARAPRFLSAENQVRNRHHRCQLTSCGGSSQRRLLSVRFCSAS